MKEEEKIINLNFDDKIFKKLNNKEKEEFRQWARENYIAHGEINTAWHPIIRDECENINNITGICDLIKDHFIELALKDEFPKDLTEDKLYSDIGDIIQKYLKAGHERDIS